MKEAWRCVEVLPGIFRSRLPRAKDVVVFAQDGGRSVVDLTRRERGAIRRACERAGLVYIKSPLPYEGGDLEDAAASVLGAEHPVLVHCFHGRDRTGRVLALLARSSNA